VDHRRKGEIEVSGIVTPDHLGGHLYRTHVDRGALEYLVRTFDIATMLDVGCGPGGMHEVAESLGIVWVGVDGDPIFKDRNNIILHDFCNGPLSTYITHTDLVWSVEFLEHVDEIYLPNVMSSINRASVAVVTAAPPGYPGHHHVNCRPQDYWIGAFATIGMRFDSVRTAKLREASTMRKPFMQSTGMLFTSSNARLLS